MTKDETDDNHLPEWVDLALLNAGDRVAADLRCIHCEYNLRTLPATGLCPECAQPIEESLRRVDLQWASPQWVGRLALGIRFLLLSHLLLVVTLVAIFVVRVTGRGITLLGLVALVTALVVVTGTTLITEPDPRTRNRPHRLGLRYAVRWGPVATIAAAVTTFAVIVWLTPTRMNPVLSLPFIATVFSGLVVTPPALFRHPAGLLRRAPDDGLARVAHGLALALLLLGAFTFLHALLPVFTGAAFLHPFRDLRIAAVLLTGVGYVLCGLVSAVVLHRSRKALSKAATAARDLAAAP